MGYEKYYQDGWKSGEAGGTPITPEALNHMEDGIKAAGEHADNTSNPHGVTAAQVGARPNTWTPTAEDVGALRNLGDNVVNNVNNDTTSHWSTIDDGFSFYNTAGYLTDQPSTYGFLLHFKHTTDIFQIWNAQSGGPTYFRSGNNSGWNGSWRKVYDTKNKPTASDVGAAKSSHNHSASNITSGTLSSDRLPTVPIDKGGTGATDRLGAAKALTNEAVSSPNYFVSLTNNWAKFGYTSIAQAKTALNLSPAMNTGTEYATNEKCNNKAVYMKAVTFGTLSAAGGKKRVSLGSSITDFVSIQGLAYDGAGSFYYPLPLIDGSSIYCHLIIVADSGGYYIECRSVKDLTTYYGYAIIKYLK